MFSSAPVSNLSGNAHIACPAPPHTQGAEEGSSSKFPVLYYLSGLTCTDENVTQKGGAQKACAKHGIAFVAPDTSPRSVFTVA